MCKEVFDIETLKVLLHCASSPYEYDARRITGEAKREAVVRSLLSMDLIATGTPMPIPAGSDLQPNPYKITDKGRKLVEMLQETPLPVQGSWEDPRSRER